MTDSFDQATYWIQRHKKYIGDPRSVGNISRSVEQNLRSEEAVTRVVDKCADMLSPAKTVIDIGCGYGRISNCFTSRGYQYLGIDISPDAIQEAGRRNAQARFEAADLSTWSTSERFDIVAAIYVFANFTQDKAWQSILLRSLSWIAPGGALLFADAFPTARESNADHYVSRPLAEHERVFRAAGFALDSRFEDHLLKDEAIRNYAAHFRLARRLKA